MNNIVCAALIAACVTCATPAAELKTGEAVLDNFVETSGGAATYEKIHNMAMKGSMSMAAMGIKGAITIYSAEPNKSSMSTVLPGVGKIVEGTDGTNAWAFSAMQGPQLKKGEELTDSLREAFFHKENDWSSIYASAELNGVEDVDGKPAYKVTLTPKNGKPQTQYYDKATGFMVRHQSVRKTALGDIPVDVSVGGYRKECGVDLPHLLVQTVAGQKIELQVDTVECNAQLPADAFQPPAEVKALIK
jgi:outer membrane lipoprotein-sorting protein